MLIWFAETTLIAAILAAVALLLGRWSRLGPAARHALWLAVLVKLAAPPLIYWPPMPARGEAEAEGARPPVDPGVATKSTPAEGVGRGRARFASSPSAAGRPEASPAAHAARLPLGTIAPDLAAIRRAVPLAWAALTPWVVLAFGVRVARSRRLLRGALPAPYWIEEEARFVARSLGVRVPEILVIPAAATPMLWFLGRPRLLLPGHLVGALDPESWRGILAHELAHLRRRDHWVRRLGLLVGVFWWWNPLYWLTRGRIEEEAELACDEWAVRAFPEGRLAYAGAILEVCRSLSPAPTPVPALGVAGAGRFLERRVTMILRDPAPSRAPAPVLFGAALLSIAAIPGWSAPAAVPAPPAAAVSASPAVAVAAVEDDQADRRAEERARRQEERAKLRARTEERAVDSAKDRGKEEARKAKELADKDMERARKGEEMAKKGEEIAKEMEAKFGPGSDFQKRMEALGKEMGARFGPDSDFAKEMERQFGPGSKFAREMEERFGPDSKFAREMQQFGADSDVDRRQEKLKAESKVKEKDARDRDDAKLRAEARARDDAKLRARDDAKLRAETRARSADAARRSRDRQIEELRAQIDRLSRQLRALERGEDGDLDEDR